MKTPLYSEHLALGAKMTSFSGWDMPLLYSGIIPEHKQTREAASIFDTSHMGVFEFSGISACSDLENLITQSVKTLRAGTGSYGYLLDESGGVLDDLICFRRGPESFRLVVNAGTIKEDAEWIQNHLSPNTSFRNISEETAKLDIQGPTSKLELERALGAKLPELSYFSFAEITINDIPMMISRTGYTGELGYELFLPAEEVAKLWKKLLITNAILPAGLGARDVLRLEMGYPLCGHELSRNRTPAGASRGRFIDTKKTFIGKDAVMKELDSGCSRKLVGLLLEGRRAARAHDQITRENIVVGEITSGLFSPSMDKAIALGYIEREFSETGEKTEINVRGNSLSAEVVSLPFYKKGTAKK